MMKKWLIIILFFVGFGILSYKWFFNQPCNPPQKPNNVPISAVWKGGCDGGSWIEFVSIKENIVRFRIYRDWNGDLLLDADFEYKNCGSFRLTSSNWVKCVGDYINGNIGIHINCEDNNKCYLEPKYPLHYQEKVE
jgi:hypothetical protein